MLFPNLELWKLYDALEKFSSTYNRKKKNTWDLVYTKLQKNVAKCY